MNDIDDIVRGLRADVPAPDGDEVAAAKRKFLDDGVRRGGGRFAASAGRPLRRRRLGLAFIVTVAAAFLAMMLPGTGTHVATADAIERIAVIAERQERRVTALGEGQFILTRYDTRGYVETSYTRKTLGELLPGSATGGDADEPRRSYFPGTSQQRVEEIARAEEDRRAAVRAADPDRLPAKTVHATRRSQTALWIDGEHHGGGGRLPGTERSYGSADERRTVRLLRRAGVEDGLSELMRVSVSSEAMRFADFTWPGKELGTLPENPRALQRALRIKRLPVSLVGGGRAATDTRELFFVAVGLLRSPLASPQLRAATVRMLGDLHGVDSVSRSRDVLSRPGIGIRLSGQAMIPEIVVDRADSRVLGVNFSIGRRSELRRRGLRFLPHATTARAGVAYQPAIVVRGAPVCQVTTGGGRTVTRYCPWKVSPVNASSR